MSDVMLTYRNIPAVRGSTTVWGKGGSGPVADFSRTISSLNQLSKLLDGSKIAVSAYTFIIFIDNTINNATTDYSELLKPPLQIYSLGNRKSFRRTPRPRSPACRRSMSTVGPASLPA